MLCVILCPATSSVHVRHFDSSEQRKALVKFLTLLTAVFRSGELSPGLWCCACSLTDEAYWDTMSTVNAAVVTDTCHTFAFQNGLLWEGSNVLHVCACSMSFWSLLVCSALMADWGHLCEDVYWVLFTHSILTPWYKSQLLFVLLFFVVVILMLYCFASSLALCPTLRCWSTVWKLGNRLCTGETVLELHESRFLFVLYLLSWTCSSSNTQHNTKYVDAHKCQRLQLYFMESQSQLRQWL